MPRNVVSLVSAGKHVWMIQWQNVGSTAQLRPSLEVVALM